MKWAIAVLCTCLWLSAGPAVAQSGDRLELRSFQPYAGLQDETLVPLPPVQRGLAKKRPEIPMPQRRSPVIQHGVPDAYSTLWYVYCARKYRSFEPGTGLYTTYSGRRRICS